MKKISINGLGLVLRKSVFLTNVTKHLVKNLPFLNQNLQLKLIDLLDTLGPETNIKSKVGDIILYYPSKSCIGKLYVSHGWRSSFFDYFFQKYLTKSNCIIEIGANIGVDTIYMAKRVREYCTIIAFEPADRYRNLLIQNISENNIKNVLVYEYFIGNNDGSQHNLFLNSASASVIENASPSFPSIGTQRVKSIAIDTFIKDQKLNNLDFLKVDTDGYDLLVLQGSANAINRFRPKLQIEFSGYSLEKLGYSNRSLAELLVHYGYKEFIVIWDLESLPSYFNDYRKLVDSLNPNSTVDVISIHSSDIDVFSFRDILQEYIVSQTQLAGRRDDKSK